MLILEKSLAVHVFVKQTVKMLRKKTSILIDLSYLTYKKF